MLARPPLPFPSPVSKMATALPPRPRPAEPHPLSPEQGRPASPPPRRGAALRAPAAPPRTSSTQVAGSAVGGGGAYFPPLCEVEAGGPHAPPARGRQRLTAAASAAVP